MQYCINHVEWGNDLTFWVIFLSINHFWLVRYGQTDSGMDRRPTKPLIKTHLKMQKLTSSLDAETQLYKRLCAFVCPPVCRSVCDDWVKKCETRFSDTAVVFDCAHPSAMILWPLETAFLRLLTERKGKYVERLWREALASFSWVTTYQTTATFSHSLVLSFSVYIGGKNPIYRLSHTGSF